MTGDRADETPEDIYKRNREASANDNTAQPWDMSFGAWAPKYEEDYIGRRANARLRSNLLSTANIVGAPMMPGSMTLGGLAAGSSAFRRRS